MHHAIKGLAIGIGGGLLGWVVLLAACDVAERPPTLAPIRVGMTVAELGAARPGQYAVNPVFRDCPKATELVQAELETFTGAVAFRLPDGSGDAMSFSGGACQNRFFALNNPSKVTALVPDGIALGTVLKRLPKGWEARITDGRVGPRDLPHEAAALARFDGRLRGETGWGTWNMNRIWWDVDVRDGRVTKIEERRYED